MSTDGPPMPWEETYWSPTAAWDTNWQNPFPISQPINVPSPPILATVPQYANVATDIANSSSFAHGTGVEQASGTVSIPEGETAVIPELIIESTWQDHAILATPTTWSLPLPAEGVPAMWEGWSDVGDWLGGVVGDWVNPATTPLWNYGAPAAPTPAVVPPAYGGPVVTPTGTPPGMYVDSHGHLVHRRRRRRRLLTESDFNDLMRIATLPQKQNVTVALAKAIGRR